MEKMHAQISHGRHLFSLHGLLRKGKKSSSKLTALRNM